MSFDEDIEREMNEKGLNAPKLTVKNLEGKIIREMYYQFPSTQTTVCLLILDNGYSVVGESSPASPSNFNASIGKRVARQHAFSKMWPLCGFALRQELHVAKQVLSRGNRKPNKAQTPSDGYHPTAA